MYDWNVFIEACYMSKASVVGSKKKCLNIRDNHTCKALSKYSRSSSIKNGDLNIKLRYQP